MKFKETLQKVALNAKKHKPEIFFVAGLIGIAAGTVICCKETLKTPDILKEHKEKRAEIKAKSAEYPDYKDGKDLFHLYLHTAGRIAWNYKWGIITEAAGFALACKGFKEKNEQYLGAVAGLSAVSTAFDEYRERVRNEESEEKDRHYMTGESEVEITDIPAEDEVDENGKKKKPTKRKVTVGNPDATGDGYGIYITRGNPIFDDDDDYVKMNIRRIQNNLNDKKNARLTCSICLNEIYQDLFIEPKKKGMIAGYVGLQNDIVFDVKKVLLPDEFGNMHDAYWIGFIGLHKNIYDELEV